MAGGMAAMAVCRIAVMGFWLVRSVRNVLRLPCAVEPSVVPWETMPEMAV